MSLDQPTLDEFVRHAQRYRSELVYETAEGYLDWRELAALSLALQRIDRHWKLSRERQTRLALALDQAGLPDAEICASAQLSRTTLHRLRHQDEQGPDLAKTGSNSAQPCGANVPKAPTPTTDTTRPEVKHAGP
jgi:hypothetical protein